MADRTKMPARQTAACAVHAPSSPLARASDSSSSSSARSASLHRSRGVRRRREESIEIEELDSDMMRQNSYNYFQRQGVRSAVLDGSGAPRTSSGGTSRKRQRTLAEQLEELCLHPAATSGQSGSRQPRGFTAWPSDVDMDMADGGSSSDDIELDGVASGDTDEEVKNARIKVFGGVPDVKGMFFGSTGARQRPMERMFRHYVTMAAERSTRTDPIPARGDEIVIFQPGPASLDFPYSLFTPEQIEDLRARHNRKKKRQAMHERTSAPKSSSQSSIFSSGGDHSWRFQELDSSDEADVSSSADDSDMDISLDGDAPRPQLAGALSHGEWFVEDDDDDDI